MNNSFTVFPAIDLHLGQVVRLMQGDMNRQTRYKNTPADTAARWISTGTKWLHVINLDGAFGETDSANMQALRSILDVAKPAGVKVQFGGGIRSMENAENAFNAGVDRVILGTIVTQVPDFLAKALKQWGQERIAVSLDAENGFVKTHGWQKDSGLQVIPFAEQMANQGLKWMVFTDIARDGLLQGLNMKATSELAKATGLSVIASGGVEKLSDVQNAKAENLAGAIIGKALYEQKISVEELTGFISDLGGE